MTWGRKATALITVQTMEGKLSDKEKREELKRAKAKQKNHKESRASLKSKAGINADFCLYQIHDL